MEDLSYIDPNSPTLRQSLADFLRGMTKKEDWQQVGQGIQNTGKLIPSLTESLARGAIAQVPAIAGDISSTLRQFAPDTMQNVFGNRVAPTTEEILQAVPRINPDYQGSSQHEMVGSLTAPALAKMLKMGAEASKGLKGGLSIAYHGTPHEVVGGFDLSKIGTGEKAQAFGHGIYFAENPSVAGGYASTLGTARANDMYKGVVKNPEYRKVQADLLKMERNLQKNYEIPSDFLTAREYVEFNPNLFPKNIVDQLQNLTQQEKTIYENISKGNLYKVDIPDEHIATMMDWDKPLGQQSAHVKKAIQAMKKHITPQMKDELGGDLNLLFGKDVEPGQFLNTWEIIHPESKVGIGEELLNKYGVKGIKYFDNFSREAGQGTRNFVSFEPQAVKILEKNGKPVTRKELLEKQLNELK